MTAPSTDVTLATLAALLNRAGVAPQDPGVAETLARIEGATSVAEALGAAETLARRWNDGGLRATMGAAFPSLTVNVHTGDHEALRRALRAARFGNGLPMLASIATQVDGGVGLRWAIILDVGDDVQVLDPNPWDDVAEERHMNLDVFTVLWGLGYGALVTF